jgi:hypothetical protein
MNDTERMIAELACRRLAMEFATFIDLRRYDAVVGLFCEDAIYNPRGTDFHGREGVRQYLFSRPAHRRSRHLISNHIVNIEDNDHATGFCNLVYYAVENAPAPATPAALDSPVLIGDYHDIYRRTDEGWRIASRIGHIVFEQKSDPGKTDRAS